MLPTFTLKNETKKALFLKTRAAMLSLGSFWLLHLNIEGTDVPVVSFKVSPPYFYTCSDPEELLHKTEKVSRLREHYLRGQNRD